MYTLVQPMYALVCSSKGTKEGETLKVFKEHIWEFHAHKKQLECQNLLVGQVGFEPKRVSPDLLK
jgi:hypothetical protein